MRARLSLPDATMGEIGRAIVLKSLTLRPLSSRPIDFRPSFKCRSLVPTTGRRVVFGGQRATMAEGCARSWRERHITGATRSLALAVAWLIASLGCSCSLAAEPRPRSVLVLDQAETTSPFYYAIYAGIRSTLATNPNDPVSIYLQSLELDRFSGPSYEASLTSYLRSKSKDRPPEALVAVGAAALQLVLRLRPELWPEVPVVFCMVDEPTLARLHLASGVTGNFIRLRLSDMMTVARSLVPNLKHVALVGDAWERQTVFGHFKEEVPAATAGVEVIDLVGLPLAEVASGWPRCRRQPLSSIRPCIQTAPEPRSLRARPSRDLLMSLMPRLSALQKPLSERVQPAASSCNRLLLARRRDGSLCAS